ncbi:hypothetical protein BS618_31410 [Rhodococcus erythropolis]|nr:hypothetical protein BS618_31410 [Rhodococcus erythropolis]REK82609.1 IS110 family transposase [Rhodococcus erythropolis]
MRRARAELAEQFETELGKHPDGPILMSLPGVGCRTAVSMLVEISGIDRFANAGHLAVYAGVAPRTHRSGTKANTIGTVGTPDSNAACTFRRLQHCAIPSPVRTTTASAPKARTTDPLFCLARRRSNVLYSMLDNGTTYQHDRTNTGATLVRDAIGSPEIEPVRGLRGR